MTRKSLMFCPKFVDQTIKKKTESLKTREYIFHKRIRFQCLKILQKKTSKMSPCECQSMFW